MTNPSKYIFNSELATLKNEQEYTLSITLPNSYTLSTGGVKSWRTSVSASDRSASFRCYVTSTKYNYSLQSFSFNIKALQNGYDASLPANIFREGNNIVFEVLAIGAGGQSVTFTDMGQTLTVHIQTFTDPFV